MNPVRHDARPELRTCPVCRASAGEPNDAASRRIARATRDPSFRTRVCTGCGLIFSDPMRAADAAWYEANPLYADYMSAPVTPRQACFLSDWRTSAALRLLGPGKGRRVLDIGCGRGIFLFLARRRGFMPSGVDFNEHAVTACRDNLGLDDVHRATSENLGEQFPHWAHAFDAVTLFDVLEHLEDPVEVLKSRRELLKPGGAVIVSVPRADRRPALFDLDIDTPPHHLTLWTRSALEALGSASGYGSCLVLERPLQAHDLLLHARIAWQRRSRRQSSLTPASAGTHSDRPQAATRWARERTTGDESAAPDMSGGGDGRGALRAPAGRAPTTRILRGLRPLLLGGVEACAWPLLSAGMLIGLLRGHTLLAIYR